MATIVSALEQKCKIESEKLKHKIEIQLQKDILKIYTESLFSDVYINVGSSSLKLHRCILQTRAPILYNIYCHNPNLINVIPVQKLEVFFRDIYSEPEVRQKEEEILKCIDAFILNKEHPQEDSGIENSENYSFNNSKPRNFTDLSKDSLHTQKFVENCFENSNNTVYYSLVDESLVLSDFSDIHEEVKEMSCTTDRKLESVKENPVIDQKETLAADKASLNPAENNSKFKKGGNFFKYFIDASDLTDESETSLGDLNQLSIEPGPSKKENHVAKLENQTPDSLDDDPKDSHTAVEGISKLENDFLRATENVRKMTFNEELLKQLYPELMLELSFSDKNNTFPSDVIEFQPTTEALKNFKNYLMEKYETLKGGQSSIKMKHSNIIDKLISEDKQFLLLKHNLEEILSVKSASKTEIAEHKFLYNEYERIHSSDKTYNFIKSFIISILQKPESDRTKNAGSDQVPDPSKNATVEEHVSKDTESVKKELVTNKSCGFFIDLKDNLPKNTKTKEISLPSKQLFSMFIDFGNSTDSDSSIGVQNKFERRKKQYFSKLEKSREMRNSASSLNELNDSKPENVPNTAISKVDMTRSEVVRRPKHTLQLSSNRRSWNVDKTSEINQNLFKHKRSFSVSSEKDTDVTPHTRPNSQLIKEFPSIGNADSTNELTINGESEISSHSCSEQDKENKTPCNSNSLTASQKCSDQSIKPNENENVVKNKESFVKLSDMDKEPKQLNIEKWTTVRMTKSATGTENWFETKLLSGLGNSRSLSRIFPDISANILSKPNSDVDDTTISSMSSVQSSSAVSTCESNLEGFNIYSKNENNNSLGQDLLRMFLDEISPDVVIEAAGRRIKAHKCILTSRCQYFAALLSGGWVESAGNVLSIQGFSYSVVHFALCYIYSGESEIPETLNIVELATLADMFCLEGLKEVVSYTLKMKYCHFFHKPCNICSVGVLECLPIAVNYGLDEIYRKSLKWICKHYVRLWCSKAFATLPRELIDKCYNQHVINLTVNNVFETLMNCDKLFSFIPQARWAEPCFVVTKRLHDQCIKYLANHFVEFLKSDSFASIAKNRTWGIVIMDEKTQLACSKMKSDQLCQSYVFVNSQLKAAKADENEEFVELLNRVKQQVESALVKNALQASQCSAWFQMDLELRNHIQSVAGLTFIPGEMKRKVSSIKPRQATVMTSSGSRTLDLQQVKSAIKNQQKQNGIRSESKSNPKHMNGQLKSAPVKQNSSTAKPYKSSTGNGSNKSPYRNKFANVKSRYMDRKNSKTDKPTSETTPSETSEVEKKHSSTNRRPSKSLVTSAHLSPAIRQTARAVSLSKIPVSVRNPSQKRTESDTTSGSDNGIRERRKQSEVSQRKSTSSVKNGGTSRSNYATPVRKSMVASRSRASEERSTKNVSKKMIRSAECVRSVKIERPDKNDNFDRLKSEDCSQDKEIPSTETSISEEVKPNIPFRRDGTFCMDEPTVLKRQSPTVEQTDVV